MPLVSIFTSNDVTDTSELLKDITSIAAAALGKPESIMMVRLQPDSAISFGGDASQPAALFEIEGIELSDDKAEPLTTRFCQLAEERLGISKDRVFVKLTNVPRGMWGGNGKVY